MVKSTTDLTARDVYQLLKDIALETRTLHTVKSRKGQIEIEVDGWQLTLVSEENKLSHCQACRSPEGSHGTADSWQRYGTDPVKLLSIWEHEQLQRLLKLSTTQE
ncbi:MULTISPECIES: hypothetical protein [Pseudomonas]|uniref:DUF7693 family protein n=1 Tax=Pseudomonas TaxID=286 RepID=UPI0004041379|nr:MULTISPECIES: hypothetical protein [Pseudomonas]MCQ3002331.1 hypothetical protein [Pseudomonas syringae]MDG6399161.1 hypothetical protein [Pseudomonas quasicaspiana]MCQ3031636.1 hypothetical protein [Pseudomonas syringae]MDU8357286.1 hypothetical protein [Pseudomonas syringae group sp. J309-1]PHN21271.1 hypothetical protein AO242_04650 [Pseudomonas sp. ICMP 561]